MTLAEAVEYSAWSKLKNPERCKVAARIALDSNRGRIEYILTAKDATPENRLWALEHGVMEILWNARIRVPNDFDLSRNKKRIATAVLAEMGATI